MRDTVPKLASEGEVVLRRLMLMGLIVVGCLSDCSADVVGPLVREDQDFQGYAVFQVNGSKVKRGDKVEVKRQGKPLAEGKVTEVVNERCLVKINAELPLFRGDILHKMSKDSKKPKLRTTFSTKKGVRRTQLSRQLRKKKRKSGTSPHVLSPAEMAAQSRRSSVYSLGGVNDAKSHSKSSRASSKFTLGKAMSVKELAKQMSW